MGRPRAPPAAPSSSPLPAVIGAVVGRIEWLAHTDILQQLSFSFAPVAQRLERETNSLWFAQLTLTAPVRGLIGRNATIVYPTLDGKPFSFVMPMLIPLLLAATFLLMRSCRLPRAHRQKQQPAPSALEKLAQERREQHVKAGSRSDRAAASLLTGGSLSANVDRLQALYAEYRYLDAGAVLDELREALKGQRGSRDAANAEQKLVAALADGSIEKRVALCRTALENLTNDDGWKFAKEDAVMRMHSRFREEDRTLSVKIDAVLEGVRPSDTLMIWREAALYPNWFPLMTSGRQLKSMHYLEILVHMMIETWFMTADLVLHGWACDALDSRGFQLFCVRPAFQRDFPNVELPLHPSKDPNIKSKLFPSTRVLPIIDILFEPISDKSVRFAYVMTQPLPPIMPSWAIDFVLQKGMSKIFAGMLRVAKRMGNDDPSDDHVRYTRSEGYADVKGYVCNLVDGYLARSKAKTA
jgi:hypothetical protein